MKYADPGIKYNFENSGLVLGWIQSKAVKYVCILSYAIIYTIK